MTTLTMKEEKGLDVFQRVYPSELTVGQAALIMGVSERQCYRQSAGKEDWSQGVPGLSASSHSTAPECYQRFWKLTEPSRVRD
jgi:hypothetical protein